jgi:hypothetical protein
MATTGKHFKMARDLRVGDVLSNGRRLSRVTVPEGPGFVTVYWRSASAKSGERKTSFGKTRSVLVRTADKVDTPTR